MPVGTAQSLITRCPACGTAFRASNRQLEARGGQVRCGRCGRVFDALAHTIELPGSSVEPTSVVPQTEPLYDSTSFMAEPLDGEGAQRAVFAASSPPTQAEEPPAEAAHPAGPAGEAGAEEPVAAQPEPSPPEPIEVEPLRPDEPPSPEIALPEAISEPASHEPVPQIDVDLVAPPQAAGEEPPAVEAASAAEMAEPTFGVHEPFVPDGVTHEEQEPTPEPWPAFTHEASAPPQEPLQAEPAHQEAPHEEPRDDGPREAGSREQWAEETARPDPDAAAPEKHPPPESAPLAPPARSLRADEPPLDFGRRKPARSRVAVWESTLAAVLLLLALAGQIAYSQRASLLVLFPAARPAAEKLCAGLHCDLPYPRRADLMSIESSNLQADTANPAVMVLTATLRNRAPFPQAQPALELTLTDGQDQALARRVLGPADYGAPQGRFFPAASEQPVKLYFDATAVKATGYRLYLFYP